MDSFNGTSGISWVEDYMMIKHKLKDKIVKSRDVRDDYLVQLKNLMEDLMIIPFLMLLDRFSYIGDMNKKMIYYQQI